jgi:O-acetyl-ADP-ribose deacetylase (regulator of RNase III)
MTVEIISGDIVEQRTDAIVNAWNRNVIPWWLLWPHGVSAAIKKSAGLAPFREVAKFGPIPLGDGVLTSPGLLSKNGVRGIIHVAGINLLWQASEYSIRRSVRSFIRIAAEQEYSSLATPIIGAGAGGFDQEPALNFMLDELENIKSELIISKREPDLHVTIVRYVKTH